MSFHELTTVAEPIDLITQSAAKIAHKARSSSCVH